MSVDIVAYAKARHTAKAYDPTRKISDADLETLRQLLRYDVGQAGLKA